MALKDSYFTVAQAAKELGVTRKTISRWLADGELSAEKVGREKLIKRHDLNEFRYGKLTIAAAKSIYELLKATIEDYFREKGRLPEGSRLEFVPLDKYPDKYPDAIKLPDEDMDEVMNRFTPILQNILKDFDQKVAELPKEDIKKMIGRQGKRKIK
jgi:excisionase family DNA binding protein